MIRETTHIIRILTHVIIFLVLTILTQLGGLIYLLSKLTHQRIDRIVRRPVLRPFAKLATFLLIYLISSVFIIPKLARPFGRVPLPMASAEGLQPLRIMTCLMNRHYVRPELKVVAIDIAKQINERYPGTRVNYLDAAFPFFNNFPLLPHLSHNDGKKMDLSFLYIDKASGRQTYEAPSMIGYGVCEEPRPGEINTLATCEEQGFRFYNILRQLVPQNNKDKFIFDSLRTRALVDVITLQPEIHKVFIEPHLQSRLKLDSDKIRFQGCQAVRHDDHIHIQL